MQYKVLCDYVVQSNTVKSPKAVNKNNTVVLESQSKVKQVIHSNIE